MEAQNQFNQTGISQTCKPPISHHHNFCKPSRWKWIIVLDTVTKEQLQYYPLDDNARILSKMKRQKRRSLGKMTGKKGVPKNKYIAFKKFKKMFPNDCITYVKSEGNASNSSISMQNLNNEQMNYIQNQSQIVNQMLPNNKFDSNENESQNLTFSNPLSSSSDNNSDKNEFKLSFDLSSLDWLLNACY